MLSADNNTVVISVPLFAGEKFKIELVFKYITVLVILTTKSLVKEGGVKLLKLLEDKEEDEGPGRDSGSHALKRLHTPLANSSMCLSRSCGA